MTEADDTYRYDAFISYSHHDKEWVHGWLLPRLEAAGLRICIDFRDFKPGLPSIVNMENAVERSRKTLIVLTPAWVESEWATFESLLIQTDDPAGRKARMIPLRLKPCEPPKRIAMLTYVDFTQPSETEFQLQRLIAAIKGEPLPDKTLVRQHPPQREVDVTIEVNGNSRRERQVKPIEKFILDLLQDPMAFYQETESGWKVANAPYQHIRSFPYQPIKELGEKLLAKLGEYYSFQLMASGKLYSPSKLQDEISLDKCREEMVDLAHQLQQEIEQYVRDAEQFGLAEPAGRPADQEQELPQRQEETPRQPTSGGDAAAVTIRIRTWWASLESGDKVKIVVAFIGLLGVMFSVLFTPLVERITYRLLLPPTPVLVGIASPTPWTTPTATSTPTPSVISISPPTLTPTITPACPIRMNEAVRYENGGASLETVRGLEPARPSAIKITFANPFPASFSTWVVPLHTCDATTSGSLTFLVRGEKGGEQFEVGIKDSATLSGQEPKVQRVAPQGWQLVSIPLEEFQDVKKQDLSSLENVSLGFAYSLGSGTIYVDEFVFVPR